jgi:prepilin-type processing-associated H-X9-DG protein
MNMARGKYLACALFAALILSGWRLMAQSVAGTTPTQFSSPEAAARAFAAMRAGASTVEPPPEFVSTLNFGLLQPGSEEGEAPGAGSALLAQARQDLARDLWRATGGEVFKADSRLSDAARASVEVQSSATTLPPIECVRIGSGESATWSIDAIATARRHPARDEALLRRVDNLVEQRDKYLRAQARLPRDEREAPLCRDRLKQAALALQMYMADYDTRLPPAGIWNDAVAPYTPGTPAKPETVGQHNTDAALLPAFHCPTQGLGGWGYAMNWKGSKRFISEIDDPLKTVALYETNVPSRNANFDGRDLIARHAQRINNKRPTAGGNFAFFDGHVKWLPATQKPNFRIFLTPRPTPKTAPKRAAKAAPKRTARTAKLRKTAQWKRAHAPRVRAPLAPRGLAPWPIRPSLPPRSLSAAS